MQVGIGLPNSIPGTAPSTLLDWSRRAELGPFSSLGVVDRVRWDCYEPLTLLSAVAASTTRIGLCTMIVIGPLRSSAVLAKEAATVDSLSGGRLILGLSVGARIDDYDAAGISPRGRGERFSRQLAELRDYFTAHSAAGPSFEDRIGPRPAQPDGPPLLVGGLTDIAYARVARYADGYVHNGGPARTFMRAANRVRTAWNEWGRLGRPKLWGQHYFTLGSEDEIELGRRYVHDYYSFVGPFSKRIAEGMLASPQDVVAYVRSYAEAGCDELVLLPATGDLAQVDRLAEVIG